MATEHPGFAQKGFDSGPASRLGAALPSHRPASRLGLEDPE